MAVIIYGMEMPESCGRRPFRHKGSHGIYYCMAMEGEYVDDQMHEYEDERHPECPLAPMEFDGVSADAQTACAYWLSGGET